MKIRTITNGIKEKFDEEVSAASEQLNGKFTQTHVSVLSGNQLLYTAIIFYEG
jgi:hypothetical protein